MVLQMHQERLTYASEQLRQMLKNADVNGDGVVSFQEYVMAEAWWRRSTLNPGRVPLF